MSRSALLLGRYVWVTEDGGLSMREQDHRLDQFKDAQPIAYRKSEPTESDLDTYIIAPRSGTRHGEAFLSWQVCRDISYRQVRKPDRKKQTVQFEFEDTDDCELTRIVALPRLGVLAAEDSTAEGKIGGWSALQRFKAIVSTYTYDTFNVEPAGSPQDLKRALDTWKLDRFSFQARPFNPHPSTPGLILSSLLEADGVGEFRGTALPKEGGHIKSEEAGIIQETLGLADKGYATFGATGRTPSGAEAVIRKQKFSFDRDENMERLRGPQQLRVYVDQENDDRKIKAIVDILVDFFDHN